MFNRKKLKKEAKAIAFANVWDILWPQLAFTFIISLLQLLVAPIGALVSMVVSPAFQVAYILYVRSIVKGEKENIWESFKKHFRFTLPLLGATWLVVLFIIIGMVALVIPSIIIALGLSFVFFVFSDKPETRVMDAIKESWNLMKGHKWEYFVLMLSFFLWYLLSAVTFGIAMIWVIPYVTVTQELYYQYLKSRKENVEEIIEDDDIL